MHKQYQAAHFQFRRYIRRRELFSDRNRADRVVEIREPQGNVIRLRYFDFTASLWSHAGAKSALVTREKRERRMQMSDYKFEKTGSYIFRRVEVPFLCGLLCREKDILDR